MIRPFLEACDLKRFRHILKLERLSPFVTLASHLIMLALLSLFAFSRNPGLLLLGNDGPTGLALADEQLSFFGITASLHSNLLEGIGNISLPYNLSLQPGYWYWAFVQKGAFAIALLYCSFAIQLFVSVLLIGWNYRFSARIYYTAAWLLTVLAFPYFESFRIYPISSSMPNFIGIILVFALIDTGIQRLGEGNWIKTTSYGLLLLLGLVMGLMTVPALLILIFPIILLTTSYSLARAISRAELLRKLCLLFIVLIIFLAAGWWEFLAGLILYSARA